MYGVVIPARDEANSLPDVLLEIQEVAERNSIDCAFYVVDDGSTDDTAAHARAGGAHVIGLPAPQGLANTFRAGIRAALDGGSDFIIHIDADGQYSAADLPLLISEAGSRTLAIGDRLHTRPDGMSDMRYTWNQHLTRLVGTLTGRELKDSQSGFRVFPRQLAQEIEIRSTYTYTQEQIIRAGRLGYEIRQPAIQFTRREDGTSRLIRSPLDYLAQVFQDLSSLAHELGIDTESMSMD